MNPTQSMPPTPTLEQDGSDIGVHPTQSVIESQTLKDVETWLNIYQSKPASQSPKAKQILAMISSFHKFCQDYIAELSKLSGAPPIWLEYSVDNVLFDYWQPIVRAAEQNQSKYYQALFKNGYKELDDLANNLKSRLQFQMEEVNIILYFDKIGKAKRFPFGSTYLIGIPLIDAYRNDWMAMPHEMGHHIYWNARFSDEDRTLIPANGTNFLKAEIDAALKSLTLDQADPAREAIRKILDDWTEEIFADTVGARIAGAEFIKGGWDRLMQRNEKKENLFASDGQHPMPYLIPYIRTYAAELPFENHWKEDFGLIKYKTLEQDKSLSNVPAQPSIQIADLQCAVQIYVQNIVAKLKAIKIDQLIQSPSALTELKDFIRSIKVNTTGTIGKRQGIRSESATLRSLLNPVILEKNEGWICRNNHQNSGSQEFCTTCGVAHYWWSYLPF